MNAVLCTEAKYKFQVYSCGGLRSYLLYSLQFSIIRLYGVYILFRHNRLLENETDWQTDGHLINSTQSQCASSIVAS
jgi:hypothetical protein